MTGNLSSCVSDWSMYMYVWQAQQFTLSDWLITNWAKMKSILQLGHSSTYYKITKIVRVLWLAERRVCMTVCKHGCDVKMFCFSRANHASTNLKKVLSWKTRQVYFIYPFPHRLNLVKSLETCCVNFFRLSWHFKRKNAYFGKLFFLQNKDGLRVQASCARLRDW